jgi:hypothetical protein
MSTKTPDLSASRRGPAAPKTPAIAVAGAVAYWLEDEHGTRVTKLFRAGERPLRLAGRALETAGHLDRWSLVSIDAPGVRHIVASGSDLAVLARPFMPQRTPEEAAALAPFFAALRRIPEYPTPDPAVTDERVY